MSLYDRNVDYKNMFITVRSKNGEGWFLRPLVPEIRIDNRLQYCSLTRTEISS